MFFDFYVKTYERGCCLGGLLDAPGSTARVLGCADTAVLTSLRRRTWGRNDIEKGLF